MKMNRQYRAGFSHSGTGGSEDRRWETLSCSQLLYTEYSIHASSTALRRVHTAFDGSIALEGPIRGMSRLEEERMTPGYCSRCTIPPVMLTDLGSFLALASHFL